MYLTACDLTIYCRHFGPSLRGLSSRARAAESPLRTDARKNVFIATDLRHLHALGLEQLPSPKIPIGYFGAYLGRIIQERER